MKEVVLVFTSQAKNKEKLEERYGEYCITKSSRLEEITVIGKYGNNISLAKNYNQYILDRDYIVVFAHDDLLIRDKKWLEKLHTGLEKYDVVGLAGAASATINRPCLWHIMSSPDTHKGRVSHVSQNGKDTFVTNFGAHGRVLMLDGVFLAFNSKKIYDASVRFDEKNPAGFHFYDIDFSLTCNSKKLKLATVDIDAVHNSHGLRKFTDEWLTGQEWFMQNSADGKYFF